MERQKAFLTASFLSITLLSACGAEDIPESTPQQSPSPGDRSLANACVNIVADGQAVRVLGDGYYGLSETREQAEPFFMKASGLGTYLFYDRDGGWLASASSDVQRPVRVGLHKLDMNAQWRVLADGDGRHRIQATRNASWLGWAGLQLSSGPEMGAGRFALEPASGCTSYPEIGTQAEGEPTVGEFSDGAVWGMADAHAHLFGSMAFAGNIMDGDVFHPLGVEKALEDCRLEHGQHGWLDITGFVTAGPGDEISQLTKVPLWYLLGRPFHDTRGYPDFHYWPNSVTKTHAMAYYTWLERAWKGGLRLTVNLLVESGPLCKISRELSRAYAPLDAQYVFDDHALCNGEHTAMRQLQATYDLQDYIDAQHGGEGKGWLRIVTTPEQAREVIRDRKMALLVGAELPDLFDCIEGVEGGRAHCTPDYIDRKLDEYYRLGIRTLFPVHHYDNDFGGANVFNPIVEIGRVVQDGKLFHYEACEQSDYDPLLVVKLPEAYYSLFPAALKSLSLFPFVPHAAHYCNVKSITPLGEYLVMGMMKRGMLIETNHMSPGMKLAVLEMAETYDYPLLDSHQGKAWDETEQVFEERYMALGGVRAPMPAMTASVEEYGDFRKTCNNNTSQDLALHLMALSDVRQQLGLEPGVVFSSDVHGMVSQSQPRFGERAECDELQLDPVQYPFLSYDGSVTFDRQQSGNRVFDFNTEGLAHMGLLPDLVEDLRRQGMPDEYVQRLFRGAEAYLQAWEKSIERSQSLY